MPGSDSDQTVVSQATPHIRINSGRHDPFDDLDESLSPLNGSSLHRTVSSNGPEAHLPLGAQGISPYGGAPAPDSSEFLLPPKLRPTPRDGQDRSGSPDRWSSRSRGQSSVSSLSRESRFQFNPFEDYSLAPSRTDSEEYDVNTQTVSEKFNIMPTDGLLLFPEDVEKDDYLHNPDPADKDRDCDIWNRRGMVNLGGLVLLTVGILVLFIGYPVIDGDYLCLDVGETPLLNNIRRGLIDPDTPKEAMTKMNADGREWKLVFSDEFNMPGRSFYDEDDPFFQAVDLWYGVTMDKEWYDPDAVTTNDGVMEIRFDNFKNHGLQYRSGMVQSWNKLCFKGGRLEASLSLPGDGHIQGFWPGFWAMGNLGRPGHAATTDGMWPYSYHDGCDAGITPNQSSLDGINFLPGMRLPGCACPGSDHPTPGRARSAPEIDVIEGSTAALNENGPFVGTASQSLQAAPFDLWYMPDYDYTAVYDTSITQINAYRGGIYQQAMSGMSTLNSRWYNGTEYQTFGFEYHPGATGNVTWFIGENKTWTLDGRAIGPNGNIGQRMIPLEPMSMIMNLGMADNFAPQNSSIHEYMPAFLRFDYVRIYQDPNDISVTCDPPGYETTAYIKEHIKAYENHNLTIWADTGYEWPKNSYMNTCS
ncbi:Beta-glucan synthesis-associated protein [Penicillium ucsense]|uniref:Beta-glucan synthesis-associated protein n=1 Tax=Penicillium ucsense TaxID=2839758 RepID=A0A8J8W1D0_9EURO|nr:Beta-glucan synthesis-associated protein [Penicillium ucsense]KAF7729504.1 Beta-glucan synthesis-associated protein [Penicillium ucsense]